MHGVTGGKCVAGSPGEGDAAPVACDRQPIWPGLIEHGFQNMRQYGCCQRDQHDVICNGTLLRVPSQV